MGKDTLEVEPLTLAEVKNTLAKRAKKAELSYIQRVTLEHTSKFSSLTPRAARALVSKLVKQYEMEEALAIQLVDVAPTTTDEIAAFVAKAPRTYTQEEIAQILEAIKEASK
jgi:DNA-directed RNA polymerase subunit F